ncbi:DUF5677 domain-containing protein [Evansella halocellulosilytica]|uniref:DUF5677 domain-containing protein n=1 Tax=Evansella halocellulosilytica TaxID=2011013 RepID=UPI00211B75B9|nr:DUF5677 domain-containing protein [Evansella halocellulosilytica]
MGLKDLEDVLMQEIDRILVEKKQQGKEISESKFDSAIKNIYSKNSINQQAELIFKSLKESAPKMVEEERLVHQEFKSRLQLQWLNPMHNLASLIKIAEETGIDIIDDYLESTNQQNFESYSVSETFDVLIKIYAKAIVISKEVYTLLNSGFSDGAMSRWRSLHELNVYFQNLTKHYGDEDFTKKVIRLYKDYSAVEFYQELKNYHKKDKNFKIDQEDYNKIIKDYKLVLQIHGNEFMKPYSWARLLLEKKGKIYFSDLEKNVGVDHLAVYYKQANYHIHASPTGLYESLGDMKINGESQYGAVFGPSNYGLSIPGQLTAISLVQITSSILLLESNIDRLVRCVILQKFLDITLDEFDEVQTNMEDKELSRYTSNTNNGCE